jgi:mono/diheme cytochrome c family protein
MLHKPFKKIQTNRRAREMKKQTFLVMAGSLFLLASVSFAAETKPPKKTAELLNLGNKLYQQNCTPCHGPKGNGKGPVAATLTPHPVDFAQPLKNWPNTKGNPEKIFEVISKGIHNSAMVGFPQFSDKDRWALVYRVMEFSGKSARKTK